MAEKSREDLMLELYWDFNDTVIDGGIGIPLEQRVETLEKAIQRSYLILRTMLPPGELQRHDKLVDQFPHR